MDLIGTKAYQRQKYKSIRKEEVKRNSDLFSTKLEDVLIEIVNQDDKRCIGIYWPLEGEINIKDLKYLSNQSLALPAIDQSGRMNYYEWKTNSLKKDAYGIPAPVNQTALKPEEVKLLLVPALAVDLKGFRLGYGGGFFDRLRSEKSWRSIKAIVIIPKACISLTPLPVDHWDVPFDGWISEEGYFEAHSSNS
ncbi:5-formyltetrahydrofolate cyclo-ligase [Prochlorococcus marinus]|uniref:5-formyltetrahydrofolate cyclo-ligase n=1 Tax=Prochlorococcus marinus (strain MIT 9211) TaxID=93059 RepID=A9BB57_PROM4|nr:5-formyltetrahydrofolate cyclo-ligase [Prochlorococcus marinus]ABX09069.1 5-formyltetrahydrofolate cyclo-ligase [Prochlorococcus marinus str. MIT 9211]